MANEDVFLKGKKAVEGIFFNTRSQLFPGQAKDKADPEVAAFNKLQPDDVSRLFKDHGAKKVNELIMRVERKRSRRQDV